MKKTALYFLILLTVTGTGCGNQLKLKNEIKLKEIDYAKTFKKSPPPIYVKIYKDEDKLLDKKIKIVALKTTLLNAINFAVPKLSIIPDADVNLKKELDIKFNNQTLKEYLQYLSDLTNYDIYLSDNAIRISSKQITTWNLSQLSKEVEPIKETAQSEVNKNSYTTTKKDDEDTNTNWQKIITNVKAILGKHSVVVDNERIGTISAIAAPQKIKVADTYLSELIASSSKQIHLQVQVLDVTVDESIGRGINWELLADNNRINISNNSQVNIDGAGVIGIGSGSTAGTLWQIGSNITLKNMLNFLQKQGKVKIQNQPNITVVNGNTAELSTGDEFSYVSTINSVQDSNSNVTVTPEVERMAVGINMKVTPKITADNRISINVVPVISSLKSFTKISAGSSEFNTPNIALQKLSTQVIVRSGDTVHLGGLIADKIADMAKGLPGEDNIFSFFFKGVQKSFERREIVILITPTVVG